MERPISQNEIFGQRLARLRKARGFTQVELGKKLGVSQRIVTYYERETTRPPVLLLPLIAKTLHVNIDELLGIKGLKDADAVKSVRIWKKLKRIELLPPKDQKAVIHYIEALLTKHSTSTSK